LVEYLAILLLQVESARVVGGIEDDCFGLVSDGVSNVVEIVSKVIGRLGWLFERHFGCCDPGHSQLALLEVKAGVAHNGFTVVRKQRVDEHEQHLCSPRGYDHVLVGVEGVVGEQPALEAADAAAEFRQPL